MGSTRFSKLLLVSYLFQAHFLRHLVEVKTDFVVWEVGHVISSTTSAATSSITAFCLYF